MVGWSANGTSSVAADRGGCALMRRAAGGGEGFTVVMQTHFLSGGSGRLVLPVTLGRKASQAVRVALSWVLLHAQGAREAGRTMCDAAG